VTIWGVAIPSLDTGHVQNYGAKVAEHHLGLCTNMVKANLTSTDISVIEDVTFAFREIDLTQYHEAGHSVAYHW
jgi:hypothetical protein